MLFKYFRRGFICFPASVRNRVRARTEVCHVRVGEFTSTPDRSNDKRARRSRLLFLYSWWGYGFKMVINSLLIIQSFIVNMLLISCHYFIINLLLHLLYIILNSHISQTTVWLKARRSLVWCGYGNQTADIKTLKYFFNFILETLHPDANKLIVLTQLIVLSGNQTCRLAVRCCSHQVSWIIMTGCQVCEQCVISKRTLHTYELHDKSTKWDFSRTVTTLSVSMVIQRRVIWIDNFRDGFDKIIILYNYHMNIVLVVPWRIWNVPNYKYKREYRHNSSLK